LAKWYFSPLKGKEFAAFSAQKVAVDTVELPLT